MAADARFITPGSFRKALNYRSLSLPSAALLKVILTGILLFVHDVAGAVCPCTYTPVTLDRVVDGNTAWFFVEGVRTEVHFALTDVPALRPGESGEAWCSGEGEKAIKAKALTERLLQSAEKLALDITATDPDGRTLAVVYADGFSVGQELMYKGLAVDKTEPSSWCD